MSYERCSSYAGDNIVIFYLALVFTATQQLKEAVDAK